MGETWRLTLGGDDGGSTSTVCYTVAPGDEVPSRVAAAAGQPRIEALGYGVEVRIGLLATAALIIARATSFDRSPGTSPAPATGRRTGT